MDWDALVERKLEAEYKPVIDEESKEDKLIVADNTGLTVSIMDEDAKDHIP